MFSCLPHRDDPDFVVLGLREGDSHDDRPEEPQSDEASLPIWLPRVLEREDGTGKEGLCLEEVDAMFVDIRTAFVLVPGELDAGILAREASLEVAVAAPILLGGELLVPVSDAGCCTPGGFCA